MRTLQELIDGLAAGGETPAIIAAEGETWSRDRLGSDAQRFAAGHRVRARNAVPDPVHFVSLLIVEHRSYSARRFIQIVAIAVMVKADQILDARLHCRRQVVVGRVLIRE